MPTMPGILGGVVCKGLFLCLLEESGAWLMWTCILALPPTDQPCDPGWQIAGLLLSSYVKMGDNSKISCLALLLLLCQLVIFWLQIADNPSKSHSIVRGVACP